MLQVTSPILFSPLLLATDGSPSAQIAQKLIHPIAQALQSGTEAEKADLIVLTVQPRRSSRSSKLSRKIKPTSPEQLPANPVESSGETLSETNPLPPETGLLESPDRLAAEIQAEFSADLKVDFQVRRGRPAIEILNCARTHHAGLIAVGHRGVGGVRELLLGSVSTVIARYAPCSVLVARETTLDPTVASLNHVLLLVDDSTATQQAIAVVRQLIPAGVQQITLLHAQPPLNAGYLFGPFTSPNPSWQLNQSLQAAQREKSENILQKAKSALDQPNLEIQTLMQTSEPGPLLCQVAQQQGINLVILGSSGKQRQRNRASREALLNPFKNLRKPKAEAQTNQHLALRNTRLDATEDYAIHHAPCPVLLCRTE